MSGSHVRRVRWLVSGACATAMAVVFLAPAFACTGQGVLDFFPTKGPANTPIDVEVKFLPREGSGDPIDGSAVSIMWGGQNGRLLTVVQPDAQGTAKAKIAVPNDVTIRPGAKVAYYQLTAVQRRANGDVLRASATFEVTPSSGLPGQPPGGLPERASNPLEAEPMVPTPGQPGLTAMNPVPAPASASGRLTPASPSPAGSRSPGASITLEAPSSRTPAAAVLPAAADQARPNGASTAPDPRLAPIAEIDVPPASDLWSGLSAERRSSLLDTPAPKGGSAPVGSMLLGSASVVLAALALLAGRRRLAPATSRRR